MNELRIYNEWAQLYDVAFSWDVTAEVAWLVQRLTAGDRVPVVQILEPACGSGRLFPAFARHGIEIVGIERSPAMAARAAARMRALGLPPAEVLVADMARFELPRGVDGAVCALGSLKYLQSREAVLSHLYAVARHLNAHARYLVQLDLMDTGVSVDYAASDCTTWEAEVDGLRVRTTWRYVSFDAGSGRQTERCRFEVLAGPGAGQVVEEEHVLRVWSWEEWGALVAASPFRLAGVYDGQAGYAPLPLDARIERAERVWHELVLA